MNGDAITRLEASKVMQQRGGLVHPDVELLIRDHYVWLVFGFGNVNKGRLVFILW
jgi:hypothetical protein